MPVLRSIAMLVGFSLLASTAAAAPPDSSRVPEDAVWAAHVDFDAARESKVAEHLRSQQAFLRQLNSGFDWLDQRYGIARDDLHGLTMYGLEYAPNTGVALLYADYDAEKIRRVVRDEPEYTTQQHGDYTLHSWSARENSARNRRRAVEEVDEADVDGEADVDLDDRRERVRPKGKERREARRDRRQNRDREDAGPESEIVREIGEAIQEDQGGRDTGPRQVTAVLLDGVIVIGSPQSAVRDALDRYESKKGASSKSLLSAALPPGTVFVGTARDLAKMSDSPGAEVPQLAKQMRQLTVRVGESSGDVFATVSLETDNPKLAIDIRDIAEGLRAAGRIAVREAKAQQEADIEELVELMQIEIDQQGATVAVRWEADAELLTDALDEVMEQAPFAARARRVERAEADIDDEGDIVVEVPEAVKAGEPDRKRRKPTIKK